MGVVLPHMEGPNPAFLGQHLVVLPCGQAGTVQCFSERPAFHSSCTLSGIFITKLTGSFGYSVYDLDFGDTISTHELWLPSFLYHK